MTFIEVETLVYVNSEAGYEPASSAVINTDKIVDVQPVYDRQAWIIDSGGSDYRYVVSNDTWQKVAALIGVVKIGAENPVKSPALPADVLGAYRALHVASMAHVSLEGNPRETRPVMEVAHSELLKVIASHVPDEEDVEMGE